MLRSLENQLARGPVRPAALATLRLMIECERVISRGNINPYDARRLVVRMMEAAARIHLLAVPHTIADEEALREKLRACL